MPKTPAKEKSEKDASGNKSQEIQKEKTDSKQEESSKCINYL